MDTATTRDGQRSDAPFTDSLARLMQPITGATTIENLQRLSGGANMESWSFDSGGQGFVLRRAPSEAFLIGRTFPLSTEAALIRAMSDRGIKAPEVVAELPAADNVGTGFIMRRVEADVSPARILAAPAPSLLGDLARELAMIHQTPRSAVPELPDRTAQSALDTLRQQFLDFGGDRPVLALTLRWLAEHLPPPAEPALLHGDYRMGNIMADSKGLAAVLDWELAHFGDPHDDLAYGCLTVWRFGQVDKPAFGVGSLEEFFAAYEANGGRRVDRARFDFWLVLRTLWWALGCMRMGLRWRNGDDLKVERVVIGRRTVENELDLLLLLEEELPATLRDEPMPPRTPQRPTPTGEPSAVELVAAVTHWIENDIKPRMTGHDKFQTAVALNAMGIIRRELERPVYAEDAELARKMLAGEVTLATPGILGRLRRTTFDKLSNDVPKYAALKVARQRWPGAEG